jgi:hypothetical protein
VERGWLGVQIDMICMVRRAVCVWSRTFAHHLKSRAAPRHRLIAIAAERLMLRFNRVSVRVRSELVLFIDRVRQSP